jgi:hypothetical protein
MPAVTLPGGLQVEWGQAAVIAILAVLAAWECVKIVTMRGRVELAVGEAVKEVAVVAVVASALGQLSGLVSAPGSPQGVTGSLDGVRENAYCRLVNFANCLANIKLSGPLGAYAPLAEAKFSRLRAVYEQALNLYTMLSGLARFLAEYGPYILSAALAAYAAWIRRVGGPVIGVVLALWVGLAVLAGAVQGLGLQQCSKAEYYPVQAVLAHCDDQLANAYASDYEAWQRAVSHAWLYLIAAPAVGGALGWLLAL